MKLGNAWSWLTAAGARVGSGLAPPSGLSVTSAVTAADASSGDGILSPGVRVSPPHATVLSRRLLADSLALGENDGVSSPGVSPASGVGICGAFMASVMLPASRLRGGYRRNASARRRM